MMSRKNLPICDHLEMNPLSPNTPAPCNISGVAALACKVENKNVVVTVAKGMINFFLYFRKVWRTT